MDALDPLIRKYKNTEIQIHNYRFVGMETFGSLGPVIAAFAVFNIVGILAFAAYGVRNHLKGEQPTRIGQCVVS